jgi:putative transposase
LGTVLWWCRVLYNTALEQRRTWGRGGDVVGTWWGRGQGKSATYSQQATELPDRKVAFPEYAEVHSQVLQEVLRRVARAYQACFRRVAAGAPQVGFPRFQGRARYHSFTYPQYGTGAVLDGGVLSRSKIGRIPVRLHRPLDGTPKTVTLTREAEGWYVCCSCAAVPIQPLPPTGRETGRDVGLTVFLMTAEGDRVEHPRHSRRGEQRLAKAPRRVSRRTKGRHRRTKAVVLLAKAHQHVRRQRRDFQHKTALVLVRTSDTLYLEDLQVATLLRNRHLSKSSSAAG